jgi:hypothetical protein
MRTTLLLAFSLCFLHQSILLAQYKKQYDLYQVDFNQKIDQAYPYSIFRPQEFLSPRALERRRKQQIPLDSLDLPLSPTYLKKIQDLGLRIHARSKWFNAVVLLIPDSAAYAQVQALPFVAGIKALGPSRKVVSFPRVAPPKRQDYLKKPRYHGEAWNQIMMLYGHHVHNFGFAGQGMHLAIFDGGFNNVYRMPAFDSLYASHRLLGTWDFVQGDEDVYEGSTHGTNVLATMGSNLPYLIVGTAPQASYYLFKTEDTGGEFWIEEFNWTAAAEYIDSLGVDLINSSLGYTNFNDTTMSYKYADMNGKTALISRAANIAASRGIIVVNSAGNEGNDKWHYIGAPADAEGVFSVGAVQGNGQRAYFSSYGPTSDGRIKPNVAAQGQRTTIAGNEFNVSYSDGTSFSSPVMAGMVAALWSAFPDKNSWEIKQAVQEAGHLWPEPDSSLGAGIPNFLAAFARFSGGLYAANTKGNRLQWYIEEPQLLQAGHWPRVAAEVEEQPREELRLRLRVYTMQGLLLHETEQTVSEKGLYFLPTPPAAQLSGLHYYELSVGGWSYRFRLGIEGRSWDR